MTNKHCDNCGDPLFRYEGRMFCPICQAEGQVTTNADQDAEQVAKAVVEADENEAKAEAEANVNEAVTSAGSTEAADETYYNPTGANERAAAPARAWTAGEREVTERRVPCEVAGGVTAARESLMRALTWVAKQAELTDDPRRITEYLTAAHKAAKAISALD